MTMLVARRAHLFHVFSLLLCLLALAACQPKGQQPYTQVEAPRPAYGGETVSVPSERAIQPNFALPQADRLVKVGLLLPITGRHEDLGRALQHAATLALFDQYAGMSATRLATRVELIPFDTGDTPEDARDAAEQAVESGVELVVGPVFSDAVQAAAPVTKRAGIAMISFSNNPAVASPDVYVFGFSPEAQARRIVQFALDSGKTRMASLAPKTPYGESVVKAGAVVAATADRPFATQSYYGADGSGLEQAISTLIPRGNVPGFDALFLPEAGAPLETILGALEGRGARTQLLGTGLWDDRSLVRRANLEGAWLASSPPAMTQNFERRFGSSYGYQPPRIASLAYDAVSLAATLAASGRTYDAKTLTLPSGFQGPANGLFRLMPGGTTERGLAVLMVRGAGFTVLSPAPIGF